MHAGLIGKGHILPRPTADPTVVAITPSRVVNNGRGPPVSVLLFDILQCKIGLLVDRIAILVKIFELPAYTLKIFCNFARNAIGPEYFRPLRLL